MDIKKLALLGESKPYCLVLSGDGVYQAVYNRKYELIAESASEQLRQFALAHHTQYRKGFTFTGDKQQPYWMHEEIAPSCFVYHLYNDVTPLVDRERIPDR